MERVADSITDLDLENENRAVRCPKCGSHTLRAFGFNGVGSGEVQLKCLTCGNEFTRPAFRNPEAKTAEDAHKFTPGIRVQMTHPNYKGERGSIMGYSGKHADLGEEQYEIQLDSGEKITNIPESAFKKIRSAKIGDDLPDTANRFFLDSMVVHAAPAPGDATKPDMLPLTEWDGNKTPDDYDPKPGDDPHPEMEEDDSHVCPMCREGKGTSLGSLGAREYFRCNKCGMDWSEPDLGDSEQWGKPGEDPDDMFGQDGPDYSQFSHVAGRMDSKGNALEAGRVYLMKGKNYNVPDLVRILNLEDSRIEAAIASDVKGAFPIVIESKDEQDYTFDPVEEKTAAGFVGEYQPGEEVAVHGQSQYGTVPGRIVRKVDPNDPQYDSASGHLQATGEPAYLVELDGGSSYVVTNQIEPIGMSNSEIYNGLGITSKWKVARKTWTAQEQKELINENPSGRARNFDKLDLSGTHYETKASMLDDPDFLWGI